MGTLKQKPSFQGSILVEIDPDPPSVVNFKEILQVASADVESYRETQYRVLESRSLAESVVKDLELYRLPEFYRSRRLFGLFESDPARIPSPTEDLDPSSEAFNNSIANFMNSMSVGPVRRSNLVEISFYSNDPKLAAFAATAGSSASVRICRSNGTPLSRPLNGFRAVLTS